MGNNIYLGVELGSTRIKTVTVDSEQYLPAEMGSYTWSSTYENGIWTYALDEVWIGLKAALSGIQDLKAVKAMGISGMMHGYLAFDENWNLLVPFRTWQNTVTADAAAALTALFGYNIPQRWSIAHLYQAVLNGEEHVKKIAHITTLAGYVHYMLTGVNAVGIGEASGMFPIDAKGLCYDEAMLQKLEKLLEKYALPWKVRDVLPKVLTAGEPAGALTQAGAQKLDGILPPGVRFAPPEGDAGAGMTATDSVAARTGNVSAGTSIFAMVVLEDTLSKVYEEIDMVTTPDGKPVAMVHCNNCTNDTNAWVSVLEETARLFGAAPPTAELYTKLYQKSLEGDADCGGILVCNYMAGEGITHMDTGRPLIVRTPNAKFTLANFFRAQLYSTMATLKLGMEILEKENVQIDRLTGHGGLFKTPGVGQRYMAAACGTPITCMETASEGGPFGMALLAAYMVNKAEDESLASYLHEKVFAGAKMVTTAPDENDVNGFCAYMERYKKLMRVEKAAIQYI